MAAKIALVTGGSRGLGRVGQPQDVGGVVAFLCTRKAKWVTALRIQASVGMQL